MKRILVAIDGSEPSWKALDLAGDLARLHGARIDLLHVVPPEPPPAGLEAFARAERIPLEEELARWCSERLTGDELVRDARDRLRAAGVEPGETLVEEGAPAPAILATAERLGTDLVSWARAAGPGSRPPCSAASRSGSPSTPGAASSSSAEGPGFGEAAAAHSRRPSSGCRTSRSPGRSSRRIARSPSTRTRPEASIASARG